MLRHHVYRELGTRPINLVIAADTSNVNLFTLAGSPASAVNVTLTINSGIYVYASTTSNVALLVPAFPAGSLIVVTNNGYIVGAGGAKGAGGGTSFGSPGAAGSNAISLAFDITIDNTYGTIGGGPGGGGGGGGEGAGVSNAPGGDGGHGQDYAAASGAWKLAPESGQSGSSVPFYGTHGGSGGRGGKWGQNGINGNPSSRDGHAGGTGGAAGKAINLGGRTVTWLGGNVPAQVLGAVS